MSNTTPPVHTASSGNVKKRKSAHEDSTSRKRSRRDHRGSDKSTRQAVNEQCVTSDAIVRLKPSRISAIISKKKISLRLKFPLPPSVQRIWLCSRSAKPVLEYVMNIGSSCPADERAEINGHQGFEPSDDIAGKPKYRYVIYNVSQLQLSLNSAQLLEDGKISGLSDKFQLVTPDQFAYLLSQPRIHVYGNHRESAGVYNKNKINVPQTKIIEKPIKQTQPSTYIDERSPFQSQRASLYVPLPPIAQLYPLAGLCAEHISPLLLSYYEPLKGIVLAYSNPQISMDIPSSTEATKQLDPELSYGSEKPEGQAFLARVHDEFAVSFMWLTVDLILLRPTSKCFIMGWINLVTESHIGLVCWNLFSASIPVNYLPHDWRWIEFRAKDASSPTDDYSADGIWQAKHNTNVADGYFLDGHGKRVEGWLKFRVENFDVTSTEKFREKGFINIQGSLLKEGEQRQPSDEVGDTPTAQERTFINLDNPEFDKDDKEVYKKAGKRNRNNGNPHVRSSFD